MMRPSSASGDNDNAQLHVQFPYAGRFTVLAVVPVWEKRGPASMLAAQLKLSVLAAGLKLSD